MISMVRGDTAKFRFQRLDANGDVILTKAPRIFFTLKKKYIYEPFILQKTIADMTFDFEGWYHFTIEPEDTNGLDFGAYIYDIEVITDEYKQTISIGDFAITKEVTWVQNEG